MGTAHLPALLVALLFGAMLASYANVVAARRKVRNDRRRYSERIGHPSVGSRLHRTPGS
jgi:hypothetical protein